MEPWNERIAETMLRGLEPVLLPISDEVRAEVKRALSETVAHLYKRGYEAGRTRQPNILELIEEEE